jgi:hypothetical protein
LGLERDVIVIGWEERPSEAKKTKKSGKRPTLLRIVLVCLAPGECEAVVRCPVSVINKAELQITCSELDTFIASERQKLSICVVSPEEDSNSPCPKCKRDAHKGFPKQKLCLGYRLLVEGMISKYKHLLDILRVHW